jgi:virulence factor Mce-like protein
MRSRRSPLARLLGNRTLLGAAVVAAMLTALYVSYGADGGLPLRPTYHLTVEVPDAAQLHEGDPVRIGGARVGVVRDVTAAPTVPPRARIALAIFGDRRVPVDSTVTVRPLSILGAKSVQLTRGRSATNVPDGGTLDVGHARPTVDLNAALSTFDAKTRAGLRGTLGGLANGVAGRGAALNRALAATAPLLDPLRRVALALADPATHLPRLITAGDQLMTALAPVAGTLPRLLAHAARTFAAVAAAARLGTLLSDLPATEWDATTTLTRATPVLRDAAALVRDLRPAGALLGRSAGRLDGALNAARPTLAQAAALAPRVQALATAVRATVPPRSSGLSDSLVGLRDTVRTVSDITDVLGPAQEVCNALGVYLRNATSIVADGDATGSWFSFITLLTPFIAPTGAKSDQTHTNAHPIEDARGCAAGNTPYRPGRQEGNPAALSTAHEPSVPPAPATARARAAGLLDPVPGARVP